MGLGRRCSALFNRDNQQVAPPLTCPKAAMKALADQPICTSASHLMQALDGICLEHGSYPSVWMGSQTHTEHLGGNPGCPPITNTGSEHTVFYDGKLDAFRRFFSNGVVATCGADLSIRAVCNPDTSWSPSTIKCEKAPVTGSCPPLTLSGRGANGPFVLYNQDPNSDGRYPANTVATAKCLDGYIDSNAASGFSSGAYCQSDGTWTGSLTTATCKDGCPSAIQVNGNPPGQVCYSGVLGRNNGRYSDRVYARCSINSNDPNGAAVCTPLGTWYPSSITCAASACGANDPHFELTGLAATNDTFTFDFHGQSQMCYCAVTDTRLALNVRMFGLPPGTTILEGRRDDPFFEGTWMDALGILYADVNGTNHNVSVVMDPDLDRAGQPSLSVAFQSQAVAEYKGQSNATWTSSDGATSITRDFRNGSDSVRVVIAGLLDVNIVTSREQELITDPPIHFLNFFINSMAVGPSVHGMYAPGAVEARLAMGTLEGLRHREYVEGADDDYQTSSLTSPDCSFNRFGQASDAGGNVADASAIGDSSLLGSKGAGPQRRLRALDSVRPILPSVRQVRCRRLDDRNAFECAVGEA
ncbi:hypothetical protein KFL_000040100 [Klebsormidium nitens]|uniref:Sushi domain-containing protein n=1 Tax=Klebsormidium nitens TaxID=105231 RepID=A0A1Y1HKZ2_KLENI|nr:hypothetical protein KFL_000040100 [Klebsormidium nitens]|eukprot:GAQ77809.1 hypothetical protein KFL_000040100 [Klebsormidium nitens]